MNSSRVWRKWFLLMFIAGMLVAASGCEGDSNSDSLSGIFDVTLRCYAADTGISLSGAYVAIYAYDPGTYSMDNIYAKYADSTGVARFSGVNTHNRKVHISVSKGDYQETFYQVDLSEGSDRWIYVRGLFSEL